MHQYAPIIAIIVLIVMVCNLPAFMLVFALVALCKGQLLLAAVFALVAMVSHNPKPVHKEYWWDRKQRSYDPDRFNYEENR